MSRQSLIAKHCALCGKPLESQVCSNDLCRNFGIKVNLSFGQREIVLQSGDTAFIINTRRLELLIDRMSKQAPSGYWKQLEQTCFKQITYLSEIASNICDLEKGLKYAPLKVEQKEKAIASLNHLAKIVELKAEYTCAIGRQANKVVLADLNLQAAEEKLESDRRIYQIIKDYEAKNA